MKHVSSGLFGYHIILPSFQTKDFLARVRPTSGTAVYDIAALRSCSDPICALLFRVQISPKFNWSFLRFGRKLKFLVSLLHCTTTELYSSIFSGYMCTAATGIIH